jgi:CRISPR/Cas system-associated endonuclease/helicase Cas3
MFSLSDIISARRDYVIKAYESAKAENYQRFLEGDDKATAEYIFPNQIKDANEIVYKFYKKNTHVVSIQKKTKVGADGLMIEIAKLLTTHIDDNFVVNPANVRIITGMSNAGWEKDMIDKAPSCFKDKIFHHGKLLRADLMNISNGLIIIDEIDTGDKEYQVLHTTLKDAGILDVAHMKKHNNRILFISATMIKELYDLYCW